MFYSYLTSLLTATGSYRRVKLFILIFIVKAIMLQIPRQKMNTSKKIKQ